MNFFPLTKRKRSTKSPIQWSKLLILLFVWWLSWIDPKWGFEVLQNLNPMILSQFRSYRYHIHPNWTWWFKSRYPHLRDMPASTSDCTYMVSCKWLEAGRWAICNQTNGKQTYLLQILIMKMKLLAFYKGIQFSINPLKFCMRQRKAFRADIFYKFDLENDLLTMTLAYNRFGNKCNKIQTP